jgi:hypothetical protein
MVGGRNEGHSGPGQRPWELEGLQFLIHRFTIAASSELKKLTTSLDGRPAELLDGILMQLQLN